MPVEDNLPIEDKEIDVNTNSDDEQAESQQGPSTTDEKAIIWRLGGPDVCRLCADIEEGGGLEVEDNTNSDDEQAESQ